MRLPMLKGVVRTSRIRSAGVGDAEQTKGEACENRFLRPPVIALANTGKELVGGKRQRQDGVYLVHEQDKWGGS